MAPFLYFLRRNTACVSVVVVVHPAARNSTYQVALVILGILNSSGILLSSTGTRLS